MHLHMNFHIQLQGKLLVRNLRAYRTIIKARSTLQIIMNYSWSLWRWRKKKTYQVAEVSLHKDIQILHT